MNLTKISGTSLAAAAAVLLIAGTVAAPSPSFASDQASYQGHDSCKGHDGCK